jgi:hypothetical protein
MVADTHINSSSKKSPSAINIAAQRPLARKNSGFGTVETNVGGREPQSAGANPMLANQRTSRRLSVQEAAIEEAKAQNARVSGVARRKSSLVTEDSLLHKFNTVLQFRFLFFFHFFSSF